MEVFLNKVCLPIGLLFFVATAVLLLWFVADATLTRVRLAWNRRKMAQRPRFEVREWQDDLTACTDYEIWCKWHKGDWQKLRDEKGSRIAFGNPITADHLVWILNNLPCCTSGYRALFNPKADEE